MLRLRFDKQMLSPIFWLKVSLSFDYYSVRKNEVRSIDAKAFKFNLHSFVFKVYPLPSQGEGCVSFKLRTEPLPTAVLDYLLCFLHHYILLLQYNPHQPN